MTTKRVCFIATLLLCAAILFNGCGNPDQGKLLFKPELNVARTVNTSEAFTNTSKLMGMDMTFGTSKDVTYVMTPTAVDDEGTVAVDVVYDYVDTEVTGLDALLGGAGAAQIPGMDDPFGTKAMQKALDSLKGERFTVRVSKFGDVLGVEGADEVAGKVADALQGPAHIPADQLKSQLRQGYGNEGTLEQMKQIFMKVPDKALNPGDSWQEDLTREDLGMPIDMTMTITAGERNAGILNLNIATQYSVDFSKGPMGEAMKSGGGSGTMEGSGSGTAEYEDATGWPRKAVITAKGTGTISPMKGMNMTMEFSAKNEITSYPKQ